MSVNTQEEANNFLKFLNSSKSHFHAVETSKKLLLNAGFIQLNENEKWELKPGSSYFLTRNQSSLVAFVIPSKFSCNGDSSGFISFVAHTDSPNLKLKPKSKIEKHGYLQVGVETYGGGLFHTWFDRDLTIAGRVIIQNSNGFESKLVYIDRPILKIPSLAIHLDRSVNEQFKFNNEEQLLPIIATSIKSQLDQQQITTSTSTSSATIPVIDSMNIKHHPILIKLLSEELKCSSNDILNFELSVVDHQPASLGGIFNEFIFSARLDNLMCSYVSVISLIRSINKNNNNDDETHIRIISLFDNEECGSQSSHGADSPLLGDIFNRILHNFNNNINEDDIQRIYRRSIIVSADMAHAIHPNYSSKHESQHQVMLHKGVVIKHNANQRYATTSITAEIIRIISRKYNIPVQEFVVRNDSPCGTTVGPILSSNLGIKTVDIGLPQLSMHSIRETGSVEDLNHGINLLTKLFIDFSRIDASFKVD